MAGYYRLKDLGASLAGGRIIPAERFAALEEADGLVVAAEKRASEIVAAAVELQETEKRRGYEEGLKSAQLDAVSRLLAERREFDRSLADAEREIAALVVSCVRKVMSEFSDLERVRSIVGGALARMRREKRVELRAAERISSQLRSAVATLKSEFPEIELIDVVDDSALAGDQVVIETAIGRVDGSFGARLDALEARIRESCAEGTRQPEEGPGDADPFDAQGPDNAN